MMAFGQVVPKGPLWRRCSRRVAWVPGAPGLTRALLIVLAAHKMTDDTLRLLEPIELLCSGLESEKTVNLVSRTQAARVAASDNWANSTGARGR